ncbi:alkaline phosphatase family protein [Streptomyces puniciscabiei]|uniref:alkaline phosphatase family protein n=1 Tax=Streptomyces puniciscabiei TaxID=164348 RepID=UPI0037BC685A
MRRAPGDFGFLLMQENRSFDHYFGRLKGVRGFDDRSGITLGGGPPVFDQPGGTGRQYPWKLSATPSAGGRDDETLDQCNGDLSARSTPPATTAATSPA